MGVCIKQHNLGLAYIYICIHTHNNVYAKKSILLLFPPGSCLHLSLFVKVYLTFFTSKSPQLTLTYLPELDCANQDLPQDHALHQAVTLRSASTCPHPLFMKPAKLATSGCVWLLLGWPALPPFLSTLQGGAEGCLSCEALQGGIRQKQWHISLASLQDT